MSRTFGSGYPGVVGRGVAGRGFPFYFWPLVWGGIAGGLVADYLLDAKEVCVSYRILSLSVLITYIRFLVWRA